MSESWRCAWLMALVLGGCSSSSLQGTHDSGTDHTVAPVDARPDLASDAYAGCLQTTTSVTGMSLEFVQWPCRFTQHEVQAGVRFPYRIVVDRALTGVHPARSDSSGCSQPDPSGFIVGYRISGGAQNYCLCDTGLCAPGTITTAPVPGTYDGSFTWSGENWTGPSDYGNPKGPLFPPGSYTVSLSATGTFDVEGGAPTPFSATAQTIITITP